MKNFSQTLAQELDPMQLAVAQNLTGPLCVLAGAGAGKTRAITYRIANAVASGIVNAPQILAVTFTTRAAGEMRLRLQKLGVHGVQVKTFHAAALAQLNYFWPQAIGGKVPEIKENPAPLVAQAAAQLQMPTDTPTIRDFRDEIAWAKVQLITPEAYPEQGAARGRTEIAGQSLQKIAQLMKAYEELKIERAVIDFEDVILILLGLLIDRQDIAQIIRKQYQYFVVDEYQDVSPMQHRLLQLWLGTRKDICVVGDVSQTIYSFAGANSEYLRNFSKYWQGAKKIVLQRDYRSTPEIVALANQVIHPAEADCAASASERAHSAENGSVQLVSARQAGKPVDFTQYADDAAEAAGIAQTIKTLQQQGIALCDIAILYRTNTQSALFENALNDAQIPYTIRGGKRFFERKEVLSAMAALRASARTQPLIALTDAITDALWQIGWRKEAPQQHGASRERWESLDVIRQMSEKFAQENTAATAESFLAYLEQRAKFEIEPQLASVTLSSLHGAKGLEWPVVFLAGVNEGLLPISYARSAAALAEERRLFYVGITRAADLLYISHTKANLHGKARKASQFLKDIWPRTISLSTQKRQKAKEIQQDFATHHAAALPLFESLRQWRKETAAKEQQPAYLILHDRVLQRIAVECPRDLNELRTIKGIGSLKLARYGVELLQVVSDFSPSQ